ncbi:plasmid stabilization protein [Stutzerimonas stutzeri]|uniref:Plasmid stabilization protein n=1 Tax=Stutzerimonas stutzeri TaxID=316 RepID=A0A2N8T3P5_STUST|nr:type II toxin-antitoxin system RelE/ParE family toxin [Stutzerimonas stutzeri]MCQ4323799.1 type II toxin-antitoxin system RelE/ParE family toxin [Stutzerimonas stutzeri]PNG09379.1 plasmid stabilization protein [Stutzerimonas stutzeri]
MTYQIRFTEEAQADLLRLYDFLLERDLDLAERALSTIRQALALLESFPLSCRKPLADTPRFRELLIPFGREGYVALFEIDSATTVTILALRHQREDDYQ